MRGNSHYLMDLCMSGDRELYTAVGVCRLLRASSPCGGSSVMAKAICRIGHSLKTFITMSGLCSTLVPGERVCKEVCPKRRVRTHITTIGRSKGLSLDIHNGVPRRVSGSTRLVLRYVRAYKNGLPFASGTSPRHVGTRVKVDGTTFGHTIKELLGRGGVIVGRSNVCDLWGRSMYRPLHIERDSCSL